MGSIDEDPDVFTVLVTGFGPFKKEYPQNPSWEIARDLPAYLPTSDSSKRPAIRVVVYPESVRVNYQVVRDLVPRLWDAQDAQGGSAKKENGGEGFAPGFVPPAHIDLLLHIGMAGPHIHYALEQIGRRDGYYMRDVDGEFLGDSPADHDDPKWAWYGVPPALTTDVDLNAVLARWQAAQPDADLRISLDAGRYLCDFIYFSSLAHLFRKKAETGGKDPRYSRRRVAFLHVPASAAPERVAVGRSLVVDLIQALVETEVATAKTQAKAVGGGSVREGVKASAKDAEAQRLAEAAPSGSDPSGLWYRE